MKHTLKKIVATISTTIFTLQMSFFAFADSGIGWIAESDASGSDPFGGITDASKAAAQSLYQLLMIIGGAVAVFSGVAAVIKIMSLDRAKRNEGKDGIFWVLVGVAILGGLVFIINMAMSIGASAFQSS